MILKGTALEMLALLEPDDVVNAVGTVVPDSGGWAVAVSDPAALVLTGDPVAPDGSSSMPDASAATSPTASPATAARDLASLGLPGAGPGGLAGLGMLVALSIASLVVTLFVRRERARRALSSRVSARLAAFVGGGANGPASTPVAAPATGSSRLPLGVASVTEADPRSAHSA